MSGTDKISGNYRKIDVVGKGSFGSALLVQSINDRKYYIMKVTLIYSAVQNIYAMYNFRSSMFQKWIGSRKKKP